ncbi:MAG: preprotein translocase subunit Sec61beta [Candidatus Altiarchaeales archaeon ex4484_2]|nr:MAG: preprotein translocase subunit Sec61beta [Candidatus Altiarchaeales archaeon ex4484_2]
MPVLKRRQSRSPAGSAGLVRYFDVDEGGPKMDPKVIVGVVVALIVIEVMVSVILF